jgi:hypothetical protein
MGLLNWARNKRMVVVSFLGLRRFEPYCLSLRLAFESVSPSRLEPSWSSRFSVGRAQKSSESRLMRDIYSFALQIIFLIDFENHKKFIDLCKLSMPWQNTRNSSRDGLKIRRELREANNVN